MTNFALPRHKIKTEIIKLELKGMTSIKKAHISRIDENHANPRRLWEKMGRPEYINSSGVSGLEEESRTIKKDFLFEQNDSTVLLEMTLIPEASILINLELA